jgi:hypothetical protein
MIHILCLFPPWHRQLALEGDQLKVQDLVVMDFGLGSNLAAARTRQNPKRKIPRYIDE